MIRIFINGLAASAGGGLTYLRNVIPQLAKREGVRTSVLLSNDLRREFDETGNVAFLSTADSKGPLHRLCREQTEVRKLIRSTGSQALVSAGNFALWNSPVPQILLSRNSLYTSRDFMRDVEERGDYAIWMDTLAKGWLARRSIRCADVTVAPSEAFAGELSEWSGREVAAIHHGFDAEAFTEDRTPLSADIQAQLEDGRDAVRLLFVSHYNYYRNFETLLRAMAILSRRMKGKRVKLYLTCRLSSGANPGTYRTKAASDLLQTVRKDCDVVELGSVPYRSLHHLYRACNIYVTPAYAESFAHPLVEAMSSGLPVVASDLAVHREICQNAGVYFSRFSPEDLAERLLQVCESPELAKSLAGNGRRRAQDFSWRTHVSLLVELAGKLVGSEFV
ncbi:MAG TPA: glycosyltransferase family 1 protein [Terriglobales bacterium]|nr:glycosyltransferase family 1 protein [Terriglobales bacterium]